MGAEKDIFVGNVRVTFSADKFNEGVKQIQAFSVAVKDIMTEFATFERTTGRSVRAMVTKDLANLASEASTIQGTIAQALVAATNAIRASGTTVVKTAEQEIDALKEVAALISQVTAVRGAENKIRQEERAAIGALRKEYGLLSDAEEERERKRARKAGEEPLIPKLSDRDVTEYRRKLQEITEARNKSIEEQSKTGGRSPLPKAFAVGQDQFFSKELDLIRRRAGAAGVTVKTLSGFLDKLEADMVKRSKAGNTNGFIFPSEESIRTSMKRIREEISKDFPADPLKGLVDTFGRIEKILHAVGVTVTALRGAVDGQFKKMVTDLQGNQAGLKKAMVDPFAEAFDVLVGHSIVTDLEKKIVDLMGPTLISALNRNQPKLIAQLIDPFISSAKKIDEEFLPAIAKVQQNLLGQRLNVPSGSLLPNHVQAVQELNEQIDLIDRVMQAERDRIFLAQRQSAVTGPLLIKQTSQWQNIRAAAGDVTEEIKRSVAAFYTVSKVKPIQIPVQVQASELEAQLQAQRDKLTATVRDRNIISAKDAAGLEKQRAEVLKLTLAVDELAESIVKSHKAGSFAQAQADVAAWRAQSAAVADAKAAFDQMREAAIANHEASRAAVSAERTQVKALVTQYEALAKTKNFNALDKIRTPQAASTDENPLYSVVGASRLNNALLAVKSGDFGWLRGVQELMSGANENTSAFGAALDRVNKRIFDVRFGVSQLESPLVSLAENMSETRNNADNIFTVLIKNLNTLNKTRVEAKLPTFEYTAFQRATTGLVREFDNVTSAIQATGKVSKDALQNYQQQLQQAEAALTEFQAIGVDDNGEVLAGIPEATEQIALMRRQYELLSRAVAAEEKVEKRAERNTQSLAAIFKVLRGAASSVLGVFTSLIGLAGRLGGAFARTVVPINGLKNALGSLVRIGGTAAIGGFIFNALNNLNDTVRSGAIESTNVLESFRMTVKAQLKGAEDDYAEVLAESGKGVEEAQAASAARTTNVTNNMVTYIKKVTATTKFELAQTIDAFNRLLTAQLDPKKTFEPIANAATALNVPLEQIVGAFAALNAGDTGEGIARLRDANVNVYQLGLEFNKAGELVTPVDEAVKKILHTFSTAPQFAGAAASGVNTLSGAFSNFFDTAKQLGVTALEPVFAKLRTIVEKTTGALDSEGLKTKAAEVGNAVATTLERIGQGVSALRPIFDILKLVIQVTFGGLLDIGRAVLERVRHVVDGLNALGKSFSTTGELGHGLAVVLFTIRESLRAVADLVRGDFGGAFNRIKDIFEVIGLTLAAFFVDLAPRAFEWAANIATSFADGFLQVGGAAITAAINSFGEIIAYFLRGFSPPKGGVLKDIDQWGSRLAETFSAGFAEYDPTSEIEHYGDKVNDAIGRLDLDQFELLESLSSPINRALTQGLEAIKADQSTIAESLQTAQSSLIGAIESYSGGADARATAIDLVDSLFGSIDGPLSELVDLVQLSFESANLDSVIAGLDETIEGIKAAGDAAIQPLQDEVDALQESFDAAEAAAESQVSSLQEAIDGQREALENYEGQTDAMVEQAIRAAKLFVSDAEIKRVEASLSAAERDVSQAEDRLDSVRKAREARGLTEKSFEELNAESALGLAQERQREAQAEKDKLDLKREQAEVLEAQIRDQRQSGADAMAAEIEAQEAALAAAEEGKEARRKAFEAEQDARKKIIDARKADYDQQVSAAEAQKKQAEDERRKLQEIMQTREKAIQLRLDNEQAILDAEEKETAKKVKGGAATASARKGGAQLNIPQLLLDQFGDQATKTPVAINKLTQDLNARIDQAIKDMKANAKEKLKTFWQETVAKINASPLAAWLREHSEIIRKALLAVFAYFIAPQIASGIGRVFDLLLGGFGSLVKILPALSRAAIIRTIFLGLAGALTSLFVALVGKERALETFGSVIGTIAKEIAAFRVGVLESMVNLFRAFFLDAEGGLDPLKGLMSILGILATTLLAITKFKGLSFLKDIALIATGLSPVGAVIAGVVAAVILFRKEFATTFQEIGNLIVALQPTFQAIGILVSGLVGTFGSLLTAIVAIGGTGVAALLRLILLALKPTAQALTVVADAIAIVLTFFDGTAIDRFGKSFANASIPIKILAGLIAGLASVMLLRLIPAVAAIGWSALAAGAKTAGLGIALMVNQMGTLVLSLAAFAIPAAIFAATIALVVFAVKEFGHEMALAADAVFGIGNAMDKEFDKIARASKGVSKALDDVAKDREFIVEVEAKFSLRTEAFDRSAEAIESADLAIESLYEKRKAAVEAFSNLGEGAFDANASDGLSEEGRKVKAVYAETEESIIHLNTAREADRKSMRDQARGMEDLTRKAYANNLSYAQYVETIQPGYAKSLKDLPPLQRAIVKAQEEVNKKNYEAEKANYAVTQSAEAVGRAQSGLRDQLSRTLKDRADLERDYQVESRDAAKAYLDERAALDAEFQGELTAEEQAAYDERLTALDQSFRDDKTARDTAYAEEKLRLQQHLAELLIETITAATERRITQLGLDQNEAALLRDKTQQQIDTIATANGLIDDNYTVLSSKIILATNNWVDSGSGDVKEFYKTLETLGIPLDETTRKLLGLANINVKPSLDSTAIDIAHQRALDLDALLNSMNGKEVSVKILTDILTGANLGGGKTPVKNPGGRVPMLATGTFSAQGGWSIVGEEGAELVYVPRSARVFKTSQTRDYLNNPEKFARLRASIQGTARSIDESPVRAATNLMRIIAQRAGSPIRSTPESMVGNDAVMRSIRMGGQALMGGGGGQLIRGGSSSVTNNRNPLSLSISIGPGSVRSGSPEDVARAIVEKTSSWWQEVHR